jgi:hypothetical protein
LLVAGTENFVGCRVGLAELSRRNGPGAVACQDGFPHGAFHLHQLKKLSLYHAAAYSAEIVEQNW